MKKLTCTILFSVILFTGYSGIQAELGDYINIIVRFTENNQNLEAIKLCTRLIKEHPDNADLHFLKGVNNYVLRNYEEAIQDFDSTIALNPDYHDAYLYRAKSKKANDDLLGALRDYNKAKNENFSQTITSLAGDLIKSIFAGKSDQ